MKKCWSILLSFLLLLSLGIVGQAQEIHEPIVQITLNENDNSDVSMQIELLNCADYESCEFKMAFNESAYSCFAVAKIFDKTESEAAKWAKADSGKDENNTYTTLISLSESVDCYNSALSFRKKNNIVADLDLLVSEVRLYKPDDEYEVISPVIINNIEEHLPELHLQTEFKTIVPIDLEKPTQKYDIVRFCLSLAHCPDFESFELLITYNPEVLEYSSDFPFSQTDNSKNSIDCTVVEPGKLKVIGTPANHGIYDEFNPFSIEIIAKGDADIAVELVSFKTADGEVENVAFDANIQNFTASELFAKYDLTGDGVVTAEDARLALRFAVGLDTATDAQCRAIGVNSTSDFSTAIARHILRIAVGLIKP